jgi:regulator of ribonuclease activity A
MAVSDLCDEHRDVQVMEPAIHHFGATKQFSGLIETILVDEDNSLVRKTLSTPGEGRVLVVDGGAKLVALVGDKLATLAIDNGWVGVVVNGYVRDTKELAGMSVGVMALGQFPRRSFETRNSELSIPLHFLGVTFTPGDWLCADEDDVIVAKHQLD